MCPVFPTNHVNRGAVFGLTRESVAGNAGLERWKNLPQAARIADRRLSSAIAKAIILLAFPPWHGAC
jgi:hypothetical protein